MASKGLRIALMSKLAAPAVPPTMPVLGNVKIAVTRVAINDFTGIQEITIPDLGWTPKAARFIMAGTGGNGTGTGNSAGGSVGATDGTSQWYVAWTGRSTSGSRRAGTNKVLTLMSDSGITTLISAYFHSWVENGVKIYIDNNSGNRVVTVEFFGGDDLEAKAGVFTPGALNATVTVNTGFEMNALFTASNSQTFSGSTSTIAVVSNGLASWDGTTLRQCHLYQNYNTPSNVRTTTGTVGDSAIGEQSGPATSRMAITSVGPTSFDVQSIGGDRSNRNVGYLALGFNGKAKAWAGILDSPTATGNKDFTGPDFTPEYGMILSSRHTALNTEQTSGEAWAWGYHTILPDKQYSNHWRYSDAAGSGGSLGNTCETDSKVVNISDHRSLNPIDADFVQWNADGVKVNFTAVVGTALKWPTLFIGSIL